MIRNGNRYRDIEWFLVLAIAGIVAALFHVHIPHTDVVIDGRWAFGFMGFALLRPWWAALGLAALLSIPYGLHDIPLWIGFGGNMLYAVPSLLAVRSLTGWVRRRWEPGWLFGLGWLALVLLCYQAFITPAIGAVTALLEGKPVAAGVMDAWQAQAFLIESVLVALFSAAAMVAVLAVERLRAQRQRLAHINRVLLGIRNVNQLIVSEDDPRRLIERACVNLTETMGYYNAWIALLGGEAGGALDLPDAAPVAVTGSAGFDRGFEVLRERLECGEFPQCMRRALETGEAHVEGDPAADCADCPLHGEYGGRAGLVRRLEFDGVTYGVLTASVPAAYAHDAEEQDLFNEVAGDLAFALHKIAAARRQEQSEQRLSLVIEGSGLGTWEWNVQTNETVFNEQWAAMLGYRLDELTPTSVETWSALTHPDDLKEAEALLAPCLAGETVTYTCELRMKHKDGHWIWILDRGRVMTRDDAGRPQLMFGTHTDITHLKRREERISFLSTIPEKINDSLIVTDADFAITYINQATEQLFGYTLDEVRGRTPDFLNAGPMAGQLQRELYETVSSGQTYTGESENIRKDGTTFVCEYRVMPFKDEQGRLVAYVGVQRDITQRKQAEEALRESEKRYRHVLDGMLEGCQIITPEWKYIYVNEAAARHGHKSPDELLGRTMMEVYPGIEESALCSVLGECFEERTPRRFENEFTYPDGTRGFFQLSIEPVPEGLFILSEDITERKQAEEALEHSHQLLQYIVEHTNSAVAVHDCDLRYLYVSQRYLDDYGVQPENIIGKHHYDVFPDLPEKWREVHRKALRGEISRAERDPYERTDGTVEWTRWECRPWHEKDGAIGGIIVYTEVITERVEAEEVLRERTELLQNITDNMFDMVAITDMAGVFTYVGPSHRVLGFEPEELLGTTVFEYVHPDDADHIAGEFAAFVAQPAPDKTRTVEYRQRCKDGSYLWLETVGKFLFRDDGTPYALFFSSRNVTERKQAEQALWASEMRFKEMLRNVASVAVQGYAMDGTVRYWNQASEMFYGYTEAEALGQNLLDLIIPPAMREDVIADMGRMAETGEANPASELELMRKDGSPIQIYSSHTLVHVPGQEPELFCIDIDITERKQAEEERERLGAQLMQAQKMESVGRLAGGVAHDFNNMLNVILGHTELAIDALSAESPLRGDLEEIQKAAERSANLTRQLLAFARKQTIAPKVLDLNETIATMLTMLQRLIGEDIDLVWKPGGRLAPVLIDPGQVDQMLANLCVNARDAIGHKHGKITIETANVRFDEAYCAEHAGFVPGAHVMLAVSDDGCGMDEETCAKIFEPFFTTKGVGEGTGLGLATIYGIVKQNDGFINVYSEPDEGTTFRIYIPALEMAPPQEDGPVVRAEPAGGTETILVVEDEPAILSMTRTVLERLGYTVLTASAPSEALRVAREQVGAVDLLITDVVMPEMHGRAMAEQLQALCPGLKSLFMSGYTANVIAHQGVLDEGVNFIEKPFSLQDLARKVREALAG
ncbi:MAG: PAS domain S-box protein [Candidatus Hydrogenedentota bacterium]